MRIRHTIRPGDTIVKLAEQYGFLPETIWDHPDNAELKALRKRMNILENGDVVVIPDLRERVENKKTTKRHRFRVKGIPACTASRSSEGRSPMTGSPSS